MKIKRLQFFDKDLKVEIQFNRHSRGQKDMEDSDIESMRKQTAENVI